MIVTSGFRYGGPFGSDKSSKLVPSDLTNPDAVSKMQQVNAACQELDIIRDVARLLDSAPVDVQERVAAWIFAKYGKSVPVTVPAPAPAPTWPSPMWPPWPPNTTLLYAAPGLEAGGWPRGLVGGPIGGTLTGTLGSAVADGFPVADVDGDSHA